jgi:hypothetical protein
MPRVLADPADLVAQLQAQLGVEVGKRLVEEQHIGADNEARASATRCCWPPESCVGLRSAYPLHLHRGQGFGDAPGRAPLGPDLPHPQPERHILGDGHVGPEGVALEDHAGVPLVRRRAGDIPAVEGDLSRPWAR